MIKYIIWLKKENGEYLKDSYSDGSMATLSIFLMDGLEVGRYISFLKSNSRKEFFSNISRMKKDGKLVTVFIYDDIFLEMIPFETTIDNLIRILNEVNYFQHKGSDRIKLNLSDDVLSIES